MTTQFTEKDRNYLRLKKAQGASFEEAMKSLSQVKLKQEAVTLADDVSRSPFASMIRDSFVKPAKEEMTLKEESPTVGAVRGQIKKAEGGLAQEVPGTPGTTRRDVLETRAKITDPFKRGFARAEELEQKREETFEERATMGGVANLPGRRTAQSAQDFLVGTLEKIGLPLTEAAFELIKPLADAPIPAGKPKFDEEGNYLGVDWFVTPRELGGELKALAPEAAKELVADNAARVFEWYNNLDPATQSKLADAGAIGEIIGTFTGAGPTAKAGKQMARAAQTTVAGAPGKAEDFVKYTASQLRELPGNIGRKIANAKGVRDAREMAKIESAVSEFVNSKRSLSSKLDFYRTKKNTDVQKYISDPHIFRGIKVEDGSVAVDEALATIQDRISRSMDAKREILPEAEKLVPAIKKTQIKERAIQEIKDERFSRAVEKKKIAKLEEELNELPEEIGLVALDDERARFYKSGVDARGVQKSDSHFTALSNAARDLIFEATDKLPVAAKGEFGGLNKYIKDMINTKEFLQKTLKGQKVKGGRLTKLINKQIGAFAGASGGPLGAILGSELAGYASDIITNRQLGNSVKKSFVRRLLSDNPDAVAQAESLIDKLHAYQPLRLPEGGKFRKVEIGAGPIELPSKSPSTVESEELARLNFTDQNP